MLERKFTKMGRSWAVIIPPLFLKILKINPKEENIIISLENEKITIEKIK